MDDEQQLIGYLGSPEFLAASTNTTRLVDKLKSAIGRKELYETHQILRTIYFRFINAEAKVVPLSVLLYHSSLYLLHHQEFVSGQDLASLFLETNVKSLEQFNQKDPSASQHLQNPSLTYHESAQTFYWHVCQRIAHLAIELPKSDMGQVKFESEVSKISPKLLNKQLLHEVMAKSYWSVEDFVMSQYHYLQCASLENSKDVAKLLVDYQLSGANKNEIDLFVAQFVFHLLSAHHPTDSPGRPRPSHHHHPSHPSGSSSMTVLGRTRSEIKQIAEKIFSSYVTQHPNLSQSSIPFTSLPLLNFTYFIISILDSAGSSENAAVFKKLCDIYKPTWSRDPNYQTYLTRIGTLYFGIIDESKQRNQGGFFNNMLMSLLDASDEEESNEGTASASTATATTSPTTSAADAAASLIQDELD